MRKLYLILLLLLSIIIVESYLLLSSSRKPEKIVITSQTNESLTEETIKSISGESAADEENTTEYFFSGFLLKRNFYCNTFRPELSGFMAKTIIEKVNNNSWSYAHFFGIESNLYDRKVEYGEEFSYYFKIEEGIWRLLTDEQYAFEAYRVDGTLLFVVKGADEVYVSRVYALMPSFIFEKETGLTDEMESWFSLTYPLNIALK